MTLTSLRNLNQLYLFLFSFCCFRDYFIKIIFKEVEIILILQIY